MQLFFDLDGTLIDSKPRLYLLFQELVQNSTYTFDEYWEFKQNEISHKKLLLEQLNYSLIDYKVFEQEWLRRVEAKERLEKDIPFLGVPEYLAKLNNKGFELNLVTARQKIERVNYQIDKFGWENLFKNILVTEGKKEKAALIKPLLNKKEAFIIGDTGYDIMVGKELGISTIAVFSGFISKDNLIDYQPDYIFKNVTEINLFN